MVRSMYRRSTAVVACLMTEALDMQGIQMPTKVKKYNTISGFMQLITFLISHWCFFFRVVMIK